MDSTNEQWKYGAVYVMNVDRKNYCSKDCRAKTIRVKRQFTNIVADTLINTILKKER